MDKKEIKEELVKCWDEIDKIHETIVILVSCLNKIADYCKSQQGCNQCLIKPWCKTLKNKCPEEWRNKVCQEIDTQVVDQDKKN